MPSLRKLASLARDGLPPLHCWLAPSLRGLARYFSALLLAYGCFGCPQDEAARDEAEPVACESTEVLVHLRGVLSSPPAQAVKASTMWVSVQESHTIARCDSKTTSVVTPGNTLASARASDEGVVALDFARTVFSDEPAPDLDVTVLFDENDDGICNGSELTGYAQVTPEGRMGDLYGVETGCPVRL